MKNLIKIVLLSFIFSSCDPASSLEATIENLTSQSLVIDFVSSNSNENKTINIKTNETVVFQEGFDIGSTYLEPSLTEYDSVVVKNETQDVLKVYKSDDISRNIYRIDDWDSSEPSKRYFKYNYKIENSDFQ